MHRRFGISLLLTLLAAVPLVLSAASQPPNPAEEPKILQAPFSATDAAKSRSDWAAFLKIPEKKSLDLGKGVKVDLVLIPPGIFKMGSARGEKADEVLHDVAITIPFYLAVTETTQAQYEAVTGLTPSWFCKSGGGAQKVKGKDTSNFPVEHVSWIDVLDFSEKSKVKGIRIPTEAEWEYACRAGTTTSYSFGNTLSIKEANFDDELHRTEKVGSYPANAFGLHDMHGNVLEWCWDGYRPDYEKLPPINPFEGFSTGRRIARGGSWYGNPQDCRSANRFYLWDDLHYMDCGFRIVVVP